MRWCVDIQMMFDFVVTHMSDSSWAEADLTKPNVDNLGRFKDRLLKSKSPGSRKRLSFILKCMIRFYYPQVDIDSIEDFESKVDNFKSYTYFDNFPDSQPSQHSSSGSSFHPSSQASSQSTVGDGCTCGNCLLLTCPKNVEIAALNERIRRLEGDQANFCPEYFISLFALFTRSQRISVRTAAKVLAFFREHVPFMNRVPSRQKTFFQTVIYAVPTIARLQLTSFIQQADYLKQQTSQRFC